MDMEMQSSSAVHHPATASAILPETQSQQGLPMCCVSRSVPKSLKTPRFFEHFSERFKIHKYVVEGKRNKSVEFHGSHPNICTSTCPAVGSTSLMVRTSFPRM